ncbi:MAG: hypothetical protein KC503_11670 [Myxococcales bacterium]|nr:hypothetical protein [Myxococcales bacterium]
MDGASKRGFDVRVRGAIQEAKRAARDRDMDGRMVVRERRVRRVRERQAAES